MSDYSDAFNDRSWGDIAFFLEFQRLEIQEVIEEAKRTDAAKMPYEEYFEKYLESPYFYFSISERQGFGVDPTEEKPDDEAFVSSGMNHAIDNEVIIDELIEHLHATGQDAEFANIKGYDTLGEMLVESGVMSSVEYFNNYQASDFPLCSICLLPNELANADADNPVCVECVNDQIMEQV